MIHLTPITTSAADDTFDEGMERWFAGDRNGAAKLFRRALKLDPQHADAHNHLGIISLETRKLKAAEQHFRAAIDGGQRNLERDGAEVHWGFIENRPYLRGLAKLRAQGASAEIGDALVTGFAANRHVAPMLLGERWERLDAFHGTNMAEPEWAHDVIVAQAVLWHAVPRGAELLRFWWMAPPVVSWRRRLDEVMVRLKGLPASTERSASVSEWTSLRSEETIRDLVRTVRTAS